MHFFIAHSFFSALPTSTDHKTMGAKDTRKKEEKELHQRHDTRHRQKLKAKSLLFINYFHSFGLLYRSIQGKNRNREQMGEKKGMEVVSKKREKTSSPLFILVCHFQVVKEGKQQPTGRNKIERILQRKRIY